MHNILLNEKFSLLEKNSNKQYLGQISTFETVLLIFKVIKIIFKDMLDFQTFQGFINYLLCFLCAYLSLNKITMLLISNSIPLNVFKILLGTENKFCFLNKSFRIV